MWVAPEFVEAILDGWADQRVMLERLERPLPAAWAEQARLLGRAGSFVFLHAEPVDSLRLDPASRLRNPLREL